MSNPFGTTINAEEILDTLGFFDDWEERYKYIIDLGKQLPGIEDSKKTEDHLIRGCQSQVWIDFSQQGDIFHFEVDSDAHIVRGLLAVVMSVYNQKNSADILAFDIESFFAKIDLVKHLSATRGNGLRSMVERIKQIASNNN